MLTFPAQKILLGHQACTGGSAAWDGNGFVKTAVTLGVDVTTEVSVFELLVVVVAVPLPTVDRLTLEPLMVTVALIPVLLLIDWALTVARSDQ